DDVDLILEFQQTHETNKAVLERTIYTYDKNPYTSATQAYEKKYSGYKTVETKDNKNFSQNSNTDIWIYPARYEGDPKYGQYVYPDNSVMELKGKLFFPEAGKYRIYLRGRIDCALYLSTDGGKTYFQAAHIDRNDKLSLSATFFPNNEKTYYDIETTSPYTWVYFKEVLIVEPAGNNMSYVGMGLGTWTTPMFTAEVKYYAEIDGAKKELTQEMSDGAVAYFYTSGTNKVYVENSAVKTETHYYTTKNGQKVEVTAEEASKTDPVAPTGTPSYVTAYRQTYEFQKKFESDYFYTRNYSYSYSDVAKPSEDAAVLATKNVTTWDQNPVINMLYDNSSKFQVKSNKYPMEITIDMGHEITANRLELYGTLYNGNSYHPMKFCVLVGNSPDNITTQFGPYWGVDCAEFKSSTGNAFFSIEKELTFRYYKIIIDKWSYGAAQFRYVKFSYIIPGTASMYSPDDSRFTYSGT
ncbi:MAG: hypothetical protein K2M48_02240, partial [Clostridiales bacterium]|nr:hypothetical protein [Clostridiales bacterium]